MIRLGGEAFLLGAAVGLIFAAGFVAGLAIAEHWAVTR